MKKTGAAEVEPYGGQEKKSYFKIKIPLLENSRSRASIIIFRPLVDVITVLLIYV